MQNAWRDLSPHFNVGNVVCYHYNTGALKINGVGAGIAISIELLSLQPYGWQILSESNTYSLIQSQVHYHYAKDQLKIGNSRWNRTTTT